MAIEFKVWWVPQIPCSSFDVFTDSLDVANKIISVLADYDAFQFKNRIKGDYCNTVGVEFRAPITRGEWWDVPDDEDEWKELLAENETIEEEPS